MKPLSQWKFSDIQDIFGKWDRKTWIKMGLRFLGGVLFIIFIVWPAWFLRFELRHKMADLEAQMNEVKTLTLRKPELLKTKEESLKFISESKHQIFKAGETALLLGDISKLAKDGKVSIMASSPKDFEGKFPPPYDALYEASLYDFTVQGGYHALGNFVSRVESNPKLLRIRDFHLRPNKTKETEHLADISVSAVSYKEKAAPS